MNVRLLLLFANKYSTVEIKCLSHLFFMIIKINLKILLIININCYKKVLFLLMNINIMYYYNRKYIKRKGFIPFEVSSKK